VSIPSADPETAIPRRAELAPIGAAQRYGLIWVTLEPDATEPLPELPEAESQDYVVAHELMELWTVSAPQVMENALDVSHVSFVHRNSVGSSAAPRFGEYWVQRDGVAITFVVEHTAMVTVQQRADRPGQATTTRRVTRGQLVQPFVFRGVLAYPETGLEHVLFKVVTPVDDHSSLFCQFIARNDRPSDEQLAAIVALDRRVQAEDKVILEGLAADYPLDLAEQVHTKADKMTVEYRRVLAALTATPAQDR
jgi:phenylpropionate dioxygenase-like ring-hydroxylating dioxygenase large terminal subunit